MLLSITTRQKGRCWFAPARCKRTEGVMEAMEAEEEWKHFKISSRIKEHFSIWKDQSVTGQHDERIRFYSYFKQLGRFLSCTGSVYPKSAEVGRRHGAARREAAAGFVPVDCCRSPHIRVIQSQWPNATRMSNSLKRQPAQRSIRAWPGKKHSCV